MLDHGKGFIQGRGAQINPSNKFDRYAYDADPMAEGLEEEQLLKTEIIEVYPKSILNKVDSPDIGFSYSMNPYQGCEHGCIYCYARNTHNYWGYSAGMDFERKILVKKNAPKILAKELQRKNWEALPIMLSGNTDCYQPIEQELKITRQILEVLWRFKYPVGLITKNSLILRDIDLLSEMAKIGIAKTSISLTTLEESTRRLLEPRTATVRKRLESIEQLANAGISVNVMIAPIIPGINDHEILSIAKKVAELGAQSIAYTMVRLNGDVEPIFEDWIRKCLPDRADKVLNKIKACHGGQLNDSRFGTRMTGEGKIADIVKAQIELARKKYFPNYKKKPYDLTHYQKIMNPQLSMFDSNKTIDPHLDSGIISQK